MGTAVVFFFSGEKTVQQLKNDWQHAGEEQESAADKNFENERELADIAAFNGYHAAVKGQEIGVCQE